MSFDPVHFGCFQRGLSQCYEECSPMASCRKKRDIIFNTKLDGMQLLFSVGEVGELLSIMQEASFEAMDVLNIDIK